VKEYRLHSFAIVCWGEGERGDVTRVEGVHF
jgi:hypothetical protein